MLFQPDLLRRLPGKTKHTIQVDVIRLANSRSWQKCLALLGTFWLRRNAHVFLLLHCVHDAVDKPHERHGVPAHAC